MENPNTLLGITPYIFLSLCKEPAHCLLERHERPNRRNADEKIKRNYLKPKKRVEDSAMLRYKFGA
jgi:hypothetical protein